MRGFRFGGVLDRLCLAFAIEHDRRHRLIGWCARRARLAAAASPAASASPLAATARLLAAVLAMRLAMLGLAARLQGLLFVLALVVRFLFVDCFLERLLLVLLRDRGHGRGLDRNRSRL